MVLDREGTIDAPRGRAGGVAPSRQRRRAPRRRAGALAVAAAVAVLAAACSSSSRSSGPASGSSAVGASGAALAGGSGTIPPPAAVSGPAPGTTVAVSPAMSAEQVSCPTASSCFTVGNVSTVGGGVPGLFKGAVVGTDAYLAYVDATGGVDGRKIRLVADDDKLSCATNEADTSSLVSEVLAFVGSFSLFDQCSQSILAKHPEVPDVSVSTNPGTNALPNDFSVSPLVPGMDIGPLEYFKKLDPQATQHVGVLVANAGSSPEQWQGQEKAMEALGYKIPFVYFFNPLDDNFTQQVIQMEQQGIQMVVLMETNDTYGGTLMQEIHTQGFHPQVIWGGPSTYSPAFITNAGGAAAVDGYYLEMAQSLWLAGAASKVPADETFLHWVHGLYPSFVPDLYSLYGWASAQLFVQALRDAGPDPTQAAVLHALEHITDFDADGLLPPADPAQKYPATCYLIAQVRGGAWDALEPADGGYTCAPYYDATTGKEIPAFGVGGSRTGSSASGA
jgi:branched-chain amino acid transport system substrate-binding protein